MTLRQKLALGFGGLLIIVTVGGIHSALQLKELGHSVDVVLRENYESVLACQDMKESLDRMDSGAVFMVLGHEREGKELLAANEPRFADNRYGGGPAPALLRLWIRLFLAAQRTAEHGPGHIVQV